MLRPGNIVNTGTPAGVALGFPGTPCLRSGDTVELDISRLGASGRCSDKLDAPPGQPADPPQFIDPSDSSPTTSCHFSLRSRRSTRPWCAGRSQRFQAAGAVPRRDENLGAGLVVLVVACVRTPGPSGKGRKSELRAFQTAARPIMPMRHGWPNSSNIACLVRRSFHQQRFVSFVI